ncbi:MAG: hypothetical protein PW786_07580 [Arachidicoccus sp.]|nr:hypothetical protein [Arachidicoccus sp.]
MQHIAMSECTQYMSKNKKHNPAARLMGSAVNNASWEGEKFLVANICFGKS